MALGLNRLNLEEAIRKTVKLVNYSDDFNTIVPAITTTQNIGVGGAACVPAGFLGQVVINTGAMDHAIGVAGRCLPIATSPRGNGYYGVEGRVDLGTLGGVGASFGVGVLGLASVANATSNAFGIVVGVRGRGELLVGTSTAATIYGSWFTTNAPSGPVGNTYANAVLGDASNNVGTRFRGRGTGGLQAEGVVTVIANGQLEVDVTDANLANGLKLKLGAGGASRVAITNSSDAEIITLYNTGAVVVGGTLQVGSTLTTAASGASAAGVNFPHGAAPTAPVNGDFWTTTAGAFVRINGVTKSINLT